MISIKNLMEDGGLNSFYDLGFRSVLETAMPQLRLATGTKTIMLTDMDKHVYAGDLDGLMRAKNIPAQYRWISLRLIDLTSMSDDFSVIDYLMVPDPADILTLLKAYNTIHSIS